MSDDINGVRGLFSADLPKFESVFANGMNVRSFWALSSPCVLSIPRDSISYEYGVKPSSDRAVHTMTHTGGNMVRLSGKLYMQVMWCAVKILMIGKDL